LVGLENPDPDDESEQEWQGRGSRGTSRSSGWWSPGAWFRMKGTPVVARPPGAGCTASSLHAPLGAPNQGGSFRYRLTAVNPAC